MDDYVLFRKTEMIDSKVLNQTDKCFVRWLGTKERPVKLSSRKTYLAAMKRYTEYSEMSPTELVREARKLEDAKSRLLGFQDWLESTRT